MLKLTINRDLPTIRAAQRLAMGCATRKDRQLLTMQPAPAKAAKHRNVTEPCYLRTLRTITLENDG